MPADTAPGCQTHAHLVEIPFSKQQYQFKTLFVIKLLWWGEKK